MSISDLNLSIAGLNRLLSIRSEIENELPEGAVTDEDIAAEAGEGFYFIDAPVDGSTERIFATLYTNAGESFVRLDVDVRTPDAEDPIAEAGTFSTDVARAADVLRAIRFARTYRAAGLVIS